MTTRPAPSSIAAPSNESNQLRLGLTGFILLITVILVFIVDSVAGAGSPVWNSPWTRSLIILAMLATAIGSVIFLGKLRSLTSRTVWLLFTTVLAILTIGFGFWAYYQIPFPGYTPPWTQITRTLNLFLGNFEVPEGTHGIPFSLEIARLTGIATVFSSAMQLLTRSGQGVLGRLRANSQFRATVIIGLNQHSLQLITSLREKTEEPIIAVVDPSTAAEYEEMARLAGALIYKLNGSITSEVLQRLLCSNGKLSFRSLYILHEDPTYVISCYSHVKAALANHESDPRFNHQILVRLDDPWSAEVWRREAISHIFPYFVDAFSIHEFTARELLSRINDRSFDRIIISGSSQLATALVLEYAQNLRESKALSVSGSSVAPLSFTLVSEHSKADQKYLSTLLNRYEDSDDIPWLTSYETNSTTGLVDYLNTEGATTPETAVILATEPGHGDPCLAHRVAALVPEATVFTWIEGDTTISDQPLVGNLFLFGLCMTHVSTPLDRWSRLGKLLHDSYLSKFGPAPDGPRSEGQREWSELNDFYRSSNIRQIGCILSSITRLDLTWSLPLDDEPAKTELKSDEKEFLYKEEHDSWLRYYEAHGWTYPPDGVTDEEYEAHRELEKWNRNIKEWDLFDDDRERGREKTRESVDAALKLLESAGYRPYPVWHTYKMTQEVRASRITAPTVWTDSSGGRNLAESGDWWISSPGGNGRSVKPEFFNEHYRHIEGNRYMRTGLREARPAILGELPKNPESFDPTPAKEGQIMVREVGQYHHRWIVDADYFKEHYELAE
ncbi:hypothetical protein M0E87_12330 [Corynebacterium sp. CCM 9185]|uniref:Ryanodine receptor Ryr domain-containing protein n=1 Tax=Corynebacterium marambiense TaxID=2765364 RepID=A0ABS0VY87_9CORY|nr:hypothetical protein [Corynebacterium marambiense]MBI9001754.1 hypothetical protein [Corynebacterium marambiense]MCK7664427.1 hypothetical protein [Corynebacterium marambiense]